MRHLSYKLPLNLVILYIVHLLMFVFKYEKFIHDFVGIDDFLLDLETKSK